MNYLYRWLLVLIISSGVALPVFGQNSPQEEEYSKILDIAIPEGYLLEVGGLTTMPNGNLGVATRRGDILIIENPTSSQPHVRTFATGLHEVLGLAYKDGVLYCTQRGELTRLEDTNMDGKADVVETVYAWPLSGHYHEYSYGPVIAPDGSFFVSGNIAFGGHSGGQGWWRGGSRVPWRGWVMNISEDGDMQPWATGMRSPAGLNMIDGELFYAENQGDWIGSGGIWHLERGDFTGHPAGLRWAGHPRSPLTMTEKQLYEKVDPRFDRDEQGNYINPQNIRGEDYQTLFGLKDEFPAVKTPAVWLPHGILGISNSDIQPIPPGHFGPFEGQVLVGDQGQSKIMRVFLEKVDGVYQGAAFDFRSGFQSGVMRMAWADDRSLLLGETNRGWGSAGEANQGLQRLVWEDKLPFEMKEIQARPDGFEITFTRPVDPVTAEDLASYSVSGFIYKYHPVYGSPMVGQQECPVRGVKVSEDGMRARIIVGNLREHHIHHIVLDGVRSAEEGYPLLHASAYYTLNVIPDGKKMSLRDTSTRNSAEEGQQSSARIGATTATGTDSGKGQQLTFEAIKPLLTRYTCTACHGTDVRQVGPAFKEIARRGYSNEEMVELIYNPDKDNWPDFATAMPPMTGVPEDQALKIAEWINSLNKE